MSRTHAVRVSLALVGALALVAPASALASQNPLLSGSTQDPVNLSGASAVAISGSYAYTAAYWAGELTAVNISNPAAPVVAGESPTSNNLLDASNVTISGGDAYVVSKNRNLSPTSNDDGTGNSLTILDVTTNPAVPAVVGSVRDTNELFGAYGVAVSGGYAFVAAQGVLNGQPTAPDTGTGSFAVVDVHTNPALPAIVAHLDNNALPAPFTGTNALEHASSVAISGHYAYVTSQYSDALTIIDISNPLSPTIVSTLTDTTNLANAADVAVQGNYAYVADQTSNPAHANFTVVDVSNPAAPVVVGSVIGLNALSGAYRVRVLNNFAYVSADTANTVAAIDISNPAAPRLTGAVTDSAHLNSTIGLDVDPTGHYVIAASPRLSSESTPAYPPFPQQAGGPSATGTVSTITLDPSAFTVAIAPGSEPGNPANQTSANFTFSPSDSIASVQCKLDSGAYGPCTSATTQQYSSLALGSHTFTVQATDAAGTIVTASYAWTINPAPPVNTSAPTITGSAVPGSQLTAASIGTWTGAPTPAFTYEWQDCAANGGSCHPIPGATGLTYPVAASDIGSTIVFTVTGTNGSGVSSASSSPTALVPAPPHDTAAPTISGSAVQGNQLTANNGTWTGTPAPTFTYQWQDCASNGGNCRPISGATSQTHVAAASDVGSRIAVILTGTNIAGSSSVSSSPTAVVTSPPVNRSLPTISGSANQGQKLTVNNGTWGGTPPPTFTYQWQRCKAGSGSCAPIPGATGSGYALTAADAGARVRALVKATNSAGNATATSADVGPIGAVAFSHASLTGISKRRGKLSFTLQSVSNGAPIRTIVVALPNGLAFAKSKSNLAKGIVIKGSGGTRLKVTLKVSHARLTITFKTAVRRAQVTIANPAITVSKSLGGKVKQHKLKALNVSVKTTESSHQTASLTLKLKPS